jgi:hypothetical protein
VQTSAINGDRYSVEIIGSPDVLWRYVPTDADAIEVAPAAIEADGESTVLTADRFRYEIHSDGKRLLTKATGSDATRLTAVALPRGTRSKSGSATTTRSSTATCRPRSTSGNEGSSPRVARRS